MIIVSSLMLDSQAGSSGEAPAIHIKPGKKDNFSVASFYLRVPEKIKAPRYILVLLPGINRDGSGLLNHKGWRKFAENTQAAIVACTFVKKDKSKYDKYNNYSAAQCGSGAALEFAIERFDKTQPDYSLKDLPLLIYGHSGGGQFAFGFSCHNTKRMIGFAAGKGGYYYMEAVEGTFKVPGLMISGQKDLPRRKNAIRDLYKLSRAKGAPWCWMEDKHSHGEAKNLSVVVPYFRELLRLQLDGQAKGFPDRSKLVGISVDLVNKKHLSENKVFDANATNPRQGWLPSKSVFDVWAKEDIGMEKYAEQENAPDKK